MSDRELIELTYKEVCNIYEVVTELIAKVEDIKVDSGFYLRHPRNEVSE